MAGSTFHEWKIEGEPLTPAQISGMAREVDLAILELIELRRAERQAGG